MNVRMRKLEVVSPHRTFLKCHIVERGWGAWAHLLFSGAILKSPLHLAQTAQKSVPSSVKFKHRFLIAASCHRNLSHCIGYF